MARTSPPQILCEPVAVAAATTWAQLVAASLPRVCGFACRWLPFVLAGHLAGVTRRGLAAQRRWFCALTAACRIDLGVWKAPRGAEERDLLGICGGIGRFNDHQKTIAATPHRSPVLWDMFAHRFPALVS